MEEHLHGFHHTVTQDVKDCIFVVVDRLKKYAHFFSITITYTVVQMAELFSKEVFRLHKLPKEIVSDQDSKFMSIFKQELFRLSGTNLAHSTSYHPRTNGQTKVVNKWLEGYLKQYVTGQQQAWIKWLHLREYYYNTTHHLSIKMMPFMVLYGYEAPSFVDMIFEDGKAPKV